MHAVFPDVWVLPTCPTSAFGPGIYIAFDHFI